MKAGELCNRLVYIIRADESVIQAAQLMREHHVGSLVVVEERNGDRTPIGMLTDRDLVMSVLADDATPVHGRAVGDVMSKDLIIARDSEDLHSVRKRMRTHGIRRIPVVDSDDVLQGIIAFDDIVEWLAEQLADLAVLVTREQKRESEASSD